MADSLPARVDTVRAFNRFYTRRIGVLQEGLLQSRFSLTESRLLWEFAQGEAVTAAELSRRLGLDAGYLSRLLRGLKERGLIKSVRSKDDARHQHLSLTRAGERAYAPLNEGSQAEVGALLSALSEAEQQELLRSMASLTRLLGGTARQAPPVLLRPHRPGDMGWIVSRHGALYAGEFGWDLSFEAMVARIAAEFIDHFDATREVCWMAEREGATLGCVVLVQARDELTQAPLPGVARLRLLLLEPAARGLGLGARLVGECERFARQAGYRKIVLWTHSVLTAARGIYQKAGYELQKTETYTRFGHDLTGETWELVLA